MFPFRIPPTWDGSAITVDVDGLFAADQLSGTGVLECYSVPLAVGDNTNVVIWSAASASVSKTGGGDAFPVFPYTKWSLLLPLTGLSAGDLIYISIARQAGDTFLGNLYLLGANIGVRS